MRKLIFFAALLGTTACWAQSVDVGHCNFPEVPDMVDGTAASEEKMASAAAAVREFVTAMQSSLQCIDTVEAGLGAGITAEQKAALNVLYNNGVDQMNAIAEAYNTQVRAFKAR